MNLDLIPVIEINYYNPAIELPEKGPFWEYPKSWAEHHRKCYEAACFKDSLSPYLYGSAFFKLEDISDNNLTKLTIDHTKEMREGNYNRDLAMPFYGGYVLKIHGEDIYFPQCCGDLSDIQYWQKLSVEDKPSFYQGHPVPDVEIKNETIIFDFSVDEYGERFAPPPKYDKIEFDKKALKRALEKAYLGLSLFAKRIQKINLTEHLNIEDIDKLLIWGDD